MPDEGVFSYLRQAPDSVGRASPPVGTADQDLPLGQIGWDNFERLCLAYAEKTDEFVDANFYGTPGQKQDGIDLLLRRRDGTHMTVQCRRTKTMSPAGVRKAVKEFLKGKFADSTKRFVLATSAQTRTTGVQNEIDTQGDALREKGIEFEVWGQERLSEKLRDHPDLVVRFFGEPWRDLYRPDLAREDIRETVRMEAQRVIEAGEEQLAATVQSIEQLGTTQSAVPGGLTPELAARMLSLVLSSSELQPDIQVILAELKDASPREAALLAAVVGLDPSEARPLILVPPGWAKSGSADLWNALGRAALAAGHWAEGETAFLRAVDIGSDTAKRALYLVRASNAAQIDGRKDVADEHLAEAKLLDDQLVAIRLTEIDRLDDHEQQLAELTRLVPTTSAERSNVARAKVDALASLRRFDEALELIDAVLAHESNRLLGLDRRAGITVLAQGQEIAAGREPDRGALRQAAEDSMSLVNVMRSRERPGESGAGLARAADAYALAGDRAKAVELLDQLTHEERSVEDVRLAACQAAIHGRRPDIALTLLGPHESWSDAERQAAIDVLALSDGREDRAHAVQMARTEFDAGREVNRNAFVLATASAQDIALPWPEDAAKVVEADDPALCAQVHAQRLLLEGRDQEAEDLLLGFADDVDVLRSLVDRHLDAERWEAALSLVERLIPRSGRGEDRMRRAHALRGLGRRDALLTELRGLAGDDDQPDDVRRRAFRALSSEMATRDYPELAKVSEDWLAALPSDHDAQMQLIFSLARLARHPDAAGLIAERGVTPRTVPDAQLMAEVFLRTSPPADAARRIADMSDRFDRPEELEGLLLLASTRMTGRVDEALGERVAETYRTFSERFPESKAIRRFEFDEDNAQAFIDMLHEQLRGRREQAKRLYDQVRRGKSAMALLAAGTGRHVGDIVLALEALPLGYGDQELDERELGYAGGAIGLAAVWDPASLTLVAGLPDEIQQAIVARLPGSALAASSLGDCDQAAAALTDRDEQEHMTLEGERIQISSTPPEQLERERRTVMRAVELARGMTPLADVDVQLPDQLDEILSDDELDDTLKTWPATIAAARRTGAPVYSDDRFVRLSARDEGVPAFGTVALLTALAERDVLTNEQVALQRTELLRRGAWGLRPTADELAQLGKEAGWQPVGGWLQSLQDVIRWTDDPDGQLRLGLELLRAVHADAPDQLELWTARVISLAAGACEVLDADDVAVGLLYFCWMSAWSVSDMAAHRPFAVALVRALRAAPRRLVIAEFEQLTERATVVVISSFPARLQGMAFRWVLRQVTFLEAKILIKTFVE